MQKPPSRPLRLDRDGRAARAQVAAGSDTQVAEGREQVGDRPLAHPRRPIELVGSHPRGQHRGEEPQAGSRIGDVQAGLADRDAAAAALNPDLGGLGVVDDRNAERLRASTMTRVSSLSRAPVSVLGPSAIAAMARARLVRLLEPGTRTDAPGGGPLQGSIVISAG